MSSKRTETPQVEELNAEDLDRVAGGLERNMQAKERIRKPTNGAFELTEFTIEGESKNDKDSGSIGDDFGA
ncbi:MAG: hypothetical protein AAGH60_03540 [Pseudomonadota bacterium]